MHDYAWGVTPAMFCNQPCLVGGSFAPNPHELHWLKDDQSMFLYGVYIYIGFQSVSLQHPFWRNLLYSVSSFTPTLCRVELPFSPCSSHAPLRDASNCLVSSSSRLNQRLLPGELLAMSAGEGVKEAFKLYDQDARRQFRGRCYPWQTDFKKLLAKPQSDGKPINTHGFLWQSGPKQDLIARGFLVFLFPLKVQTALAATK